MKQAISAFLFACLLLPRPSGAESPLKSPDAARPRINARSAILMDASSGTILWEKNADETIPPASLTKLMTLHLTYKAIAEKRISKDQIVTVTDTDTRIALQWNSSVMYLEPGMRVDVATLMKGLAIVSANDAAYALARTVSGSVELFVEEMNREAKALGFAVMSFEEPSGLSERNAVTAREFAEFSRMYLVMHPGSLAELHSQRHLDFPRQENMPPERIARTGIMRNKNDLLFTYPGCDGLKTGFIVESGYNIVLTAERDSMRLLAVILGGSSQEVRRSDGAEILDYGFDNWTTVRVDPGMIEPVRVYGGSPWQIVPVPGTTLAVSVPKTVKEPLECRKELVRYTVAPVYEGTVLGMITYSSGNRVLGRIPLVAGETSGNSNPLMNASDSLQLAIRSILNLD